MPERLELAMAMIRERRTVRIDDICDGLGVSAPTARRDLERLEQGGLIRRVHGGAVLIERLLDEPLFDDKTAMAGRQKKAIALAAARIVGEDETLYLDGGSTVLELARLLRDRTNLNIVTNSLRTALELSGSGPKVTLIGGRLRRRSQTMVGPLTSHVLCQLHFDKAFMGTIGVTIDDGMTTTHPDEAYTKRLAMEHSSEVILLADSSKIGKISFAHAGGVESISTIVTDSGADADFLKRIRKMKINIIKGKNI